MGPKFEPEAFFFQIQFHENVSRETKLATWTKIQFVLPFNMGFD